MFKQLHNTLLVDSLAKIVSFNNHALIVVDFVTFWCALFKNDESDPGTS